MIDCGLIYFLNHSSSEDDELEDDEEEDTFLFPYTFLLGLDIIFLLESIWPDSD